MDLKRILTVLLSIFMIMALTACGAGTPGKTDAPEEKTAEPTQQATDAPETEEPSDTAPEPTAENTPEPTYPIEADRSDAIYNAENFNAIWLGMPREELEANFEPQAETEGGYIPYDNFGFFVKYWGNDTVLELLVYLDGRWMTAPGLKVGDSENTAEELYGAPTSAIDNVSFYYFIGSEQLTEMADLTKIDLNKYYSMRVMFEENAVSSISFVRFA